MTESIVSKAVKAVKPSRVAGRRKSLTIPDKAAAVALWREGSMTLEDLSKKFKRRPETLSRMFKRMGVEKGSAVAEAVKKIVVAADERIMTDTQETLKKIMAVKSSYGAMSTGVAQLAWATLRRTHEAKLDIGTLKDVMAVLKMAGEIIGNSRKEMFAVLNVDKHDEIENYDELPELVVRELTGAEVVQLQLQPDEMALDSDSGGGMMPDLDLEGS